MRCTNSKFQLHTDRPKAAVRSVLLAVVCVLLLSGCGNLPFDMPYQTGASVSGFNVISKANRQTADPFAKDLCFSTADITPTSVANGVADAKSVVLFSLSDTDVLYSKNAYEQLAPASLTKIMTAYVALKYGNLSQPLVATSAVTITESGAQLCGLKPGDTMTLEQALKIMLVYSANDAAMLIADCIGGNVDRFVELMNEEAKLLGATGTHFSNPHGLTEETHFSTAYDLYLILNAAMQNQTIWEIVQLQEYQTSYNDANGKVKEFNKKTTNLFLRGDYTSPANVTVVGGKTGTTKAAGHCLMLYALSDDNKPYIAIIMGASSTEGLYTGMIDLLDEINK